MLKCYLPTTSHAQKAIYECGKWKESGENEDSQPRNGILDQVGSEMWASVAQAQHKEETHGGSTGLRKGDPGDCGKASPGAETAC